MAKNSITFSDNLQVVLTCLQENIDLLGLRIYEEEEKRRKVKEGDKPIDNEKRIENIKFAKEHTEAQLARLQALSDKGDAYVVPTFDDLKKILKFVKAFREDVYNDSYSMNLSGSESSKLKQVDTLIEKVEKATSEEIAKPKKPTYEHIMGGTTDTTYQRYMQYHLKHKVYEEKISAIQTEMDRITNGVEDDSAEFDMLSTSYQELLAQAKELQKAKANGSITPVTYAVRARSLKSRIDIAKNKLAIRAKAFQMRVDSVLANISTCSQVFEMIKSSFEYMTREDFMSFVDESMEALDSVYHVLLSNFPTDQDVTRMGDAVLELQKLAEENRQRAHESQSQIQMPELDLNVDLNVDPLEGLFDDDKISQELDQILEENTSGKRFVSIDSDDED